MKLIFIMETTIVDPYTTRYVSLGSGPHERAAACNCGYRTATPKRKGRCYTHLNSDPVLISHDKQQKSMNERRGISPLIKQLNREHCQTSSEKSRLKRRPFSAMTQSQLDSFYEKSPLVNRLIAVKGKNMSYQQRPVARRVSESSLIDQAIDSVQQATCAELAKLSSAVSSLNWIDVPVPPCPSPEELVDDSINLDVSNFEMQVGEYMGDSPRLVLEEKKTEREENFHEIIAESAFNHHQVFKSDLMRSQVKKSFQGKNGAFATKLEVSVPTGRENEIADIDDDSPGEAASACASSGMAPLSVSAIGELEMPNSYSEKRQEKGFLKKKRPFSASATSYSAVRTKNIEFLSENDFANAKLNVSEKTLETLLYMDFLKEKERLRKEVSNRDVESLGKCLSNTCKLNLEKKIRNDEIPTEMQQVLTVTHITGSSTESPTKRFHTNPLAEPPGSNVGAVVTNRNCANEEATANGRFRQGKADIRSTSVLPRKGALHKANKEKDRKMVRRQEVSLIWRSISGIDQRSREKKSLEHAENEAVHGAEVALGKKNEFEIDCDRSVDSELNCSENKTGDKLKQSSEARETKLGVKGALGYTPNESSRKLTEVKEGRLASKKRISFGRPEEKQPILRPTSAVIQRHLETKALRGTNGAGRKQTDAEAKPKKSVSAQTRQQTSKRRPVSAVYVRKTSSENKRGLKTRVVSSENLDLKPSNTQIFPLTKKEEQNTIKPPKTGATTRDRGSVPKRPISAPSRPSRKHLNADAIDIIEEEQTVSGECNKVFEACQKSGIKVSIDTLRRALMPPRETARPYSRQNLPHHSRLLSTPSVWSGD